MASVHDVAAYILLKTGPISAMKLQKLVYYSQAWSLVWDEEPLFDERIEAWANGPVVPELYRVYRGQFTIEESLLGDPSNLNEEQRKTIDLVVDFYGEFPAHQLSEMTHRETPWKSARGGLPAGARGCEEISIAAMAEYYDGLAASE